MQRLQTITATSSAPNIIKLLPYDLQPYIYSFIEDEVKVHYWMEKYDWEDTIYELGEYYNEFHLIESYYKYVLNSPISKEEFFKQSSIYREKNKWRDWSGRITHVTWSWNDDNCNYDKLFQGLANTLYAQYEIRDDMGGLYKYLSYLITLYNDMECD